MTRVTDAELLIASIEELRAMPRLVGDGSQESVVLAEAAQLCLDANAELASAIDAGRPRELTAVVIARYKRRWRFRILLLTVFTPLALLGLALLGIAVTALVTTFIWRPH